MQQDEISHDSQIRAIEQSQAVVFESNTAQENHLHAIQNNENTRHTHEVHSPIKQANQFSNTAHRLNRNRVNQHHSYSAREVLSLDELYIYDAQIHSIKAEMDIHATELPEKLEALLTRLSEQPAQAYADFLEDLQALKTQCDRATLREKELYDILGRTENQGLSFKTVDVAQLEQFLSDAKAQLSVMPDMHTIQACPALSREFEQVDMKISVLDKEIIRRKVYDIANDTHYTIRPLRSVKSAIYYLNRFIQFEEPRTHLWRAIKMLLKLRQLAHFLKNPIDNQLSEQHTEQLKEVIKQGSYEWDEAFLDKGSSVWDYGAFHMLKIPLLIPSIHEIGEEEEISLSVIPDYLVHQMRILLNEVGLRKKSAPHQYTHAHTKRHHDGF